jgi:hypothetical protein
MRGEKEATVAELRSLGDSRTVVLHTNDNQLYKKLRDSAKLISIVPYQQEQGERVALVAVDLYFPKECGKWLQENFGVHIAR